MRLAALGALLLAVYAATLTIPATAGERYAGDELHHLLAARSWVEDGDLDLADQYTERQWRAFSGRAVETSGTAVLGRLREPQGVGMPLAISPAYALGGARAVELAIAVLVAFTFTPDGKVLFVNIQASSGLTFAIWGPWKRGVL